MMMVVMVVVVMMMMMMMMMMMNIMPLEVSCTYTFQFLAFNDINMGEVQRGMYEQYCTFDFEILYFESKLLMY